MISIFQFNRILVINFKYSKKFDFKIPFSYKYNNVSNLDHLLKVTYRMPKQVTHTVALKKQRLKLKEKGQKYIPGNVTLQVLGSGARGAPRSLYIFTDQSRYLFNCGEGTQRLAHEHKMKLSKLEHIFVTNSIWENIGGLPGVALTIQDVGVPQITIHGPPGVEEIFTATQRFVVLRHLTIKTAMCSKGLIFEDNVMKVHYVPLYSVEAKSQLAAPSCLRSSSRSPEWESGSEDSSDDDIDYYAYWQSGSKLTSPMLNCSPTHNKKRRHLSPDGKMLKKENLPAGSMTMAYVCRLHDRPGSLNLQACLDHGVPPGPLLGQLKAGKDVTLPDGRIILSKDVTSADEPGPVFIVVECPSKEFLDSLTQEEIFKNYQIGAEFKEVAYLVVHFTPPDIIENPRYQEWMGRFSPSTHHLVLNSSNNCLGSVAVHRIQHKLHMLSPELFPLLFDQNSSSTDHLEVKHINEVTEEERLATLKTQFSIITGNTFNNIHLRPQRILDCSPKLILDPEQYCQETLSVEGFPEVLSDLKSQLALMTDGQRKFPKVVFLGTGSCIPNKTRNTSGILIHLSESSYMIVDCGEATYGQIVRLYGLSKTETILRGLRSVYISHLHADHHIGLVGILKARLRVCDSPKTLYLLAPKQIRTWLNIYHSHFELILTGLRLIDNRKLLYGDILLDHTIMTQLLDSLGLSQVQTCIVKHCPNAFGVCFAHSDGWKITYSGDTMPCDDLIMLGKGSDLLIHEATMEDNLEEEAKLKMHSTTSQAIQVGKQMEARFTLLTHFSQRYAKVPIFNENFTSNVGIAFDNMQVCLSDLSKLPLMYPALKLMFAEHYEEMELKAIKRQLQQEREIMKLSV